MYADDLTRQIVAGAILALPLTEGRARAVLAALGELSVNPNGEARAGELQDCFETTVASGLIAIFDTDAAGVRLWGLHPNKAAASYTAIKCRNRARATGRVPAAHAVIAAEAWGPVRGCERPNKTQLDTARELLERQIERGSGEAGFELVAWRGGWRGGVSFPSIRFAGLVGIAPEQTDAARDQLAARGERAIDDVRTVLEALREGSF